MKSKLILPMFLSNALAGVGSGVMLLLSGGDVVWLGALAATLPLPFFLLVLVNALGISRTSKRLPALQVVNATGFATVAYTLSTLQTPPAVHQVIALGISVIGFASLHWYIWSFSTYGPRNSASISRGHSLPTLPLKRLDGSDIDSSSFAGSKTLLVFFRANWCPFCMNQLKEVKKSAERLKRQGVEVKFISNQGLENSRELAKKLDLPGHFEILQDEGLKAARALEIEDIDGSPVGMKGFPKDTVMATVIALDEEGRVLFGDETDNYRRRPHPDTFLDVFDGTESRTLRIGRPAIA